MVSTQPASISRRGEPITDAVGKPHGDAVAMDERIAQKYLHTIRQSVTGALDTSCRADGWRSNKDEFGLTRIPDTARTMIGAKRLENVRECIETVCKDGIVGDFAELGCWSGGCGIWAKACFEVYNTDELHNRRGVWLADTFSSMGNDMVHSYMPVWRLMASVMPHVWRWLPLAMKRRLVSRVLETEFPKEEYDQSTIDWIGTNTLTWCPDVRNPELTAQRSSLEDVTEAFARHGLLDDDVHFLKGWFSETLPGAPIQQLAILRLDGDFYASTMDGLTNLYHKLTPGGFCIVDDYGAFEECKRAVTEFRAEHGIVEEIVPIDSEGVYWRVDTVPASCIPAA